ncbi:hypothetical protein ACFLYS_00560 [Chloroflexota bacterium]
MKKTLKIFTLVTFALVLTLSTGIFGVSAAVDNVGKGSEQTQPAGRILQVPFADSAEPAIITAPASVLLDESVDNDYVQVFNEQQDVLLPGALNIDYGYSDFDSASSIPAGVVVDSHFIHLDQRGITDWIRGVGYITFDGEILAVICSDGNLDDSDWLGTGTLYPTGLVNRGLELGPDSNSAKNYQDLILISGNTLTIDLQALNVMDQIRVITKTDINIIPDPPVAYNPTCDSHSISVQLDPPLDGITVNYIIISGPNAGLTGSGVTANGGFVVLPSYPGTDIGLDVILIWIDRDMNGCFCECTDSAILAYKYWFDNWLSGGGHIKSEVLNNRGKSSTSKVIYTFGGTVACLEDGVIWGQFQVTDHMTKESWHCHNDFFRLVFYGGDTLSPPASNDTAQFVGMFTSNKGGQRLVHITIWDDQEPGSGYDHISVKYSEDGGTSWIPWFSDYISGGNLQIHEGSKG